MDILSKTMAESPSAQQKKTVAGRWKPALLATAVPLGLIAVLWFVFHEQLTPAVRVKTGRVLLLEQDSRSAGTSGSGLSELLFQASGWVEPDPWPVNLAVKVDGFVEQVFIKEGETVTNGQIVATLDPSDTQLSFEVAESTVQAAEKQLAAAGARLTAKRDVWERYSNTPPSVISRQDWVRIKQEFFEAEAEEQAVRAALGVAMAQRNAAQLALDRTVVQASMDGIVLRRYVEPGDKRMTGADDPDSAIIASLYKPEELQIRVDVPIAEAGKISIGQPTRTFTALLPGRTFTGRVTRVVGQADLQRNTLQVKVKIDLPDERLRPEVLCRVEFWKPTNTAEKGSPSSGSHSLWIPIEALQSNALTQDIWVVDPLEQTVHKRTIELTSAVRDGFHQVAAGLRANETIILENSASLKDGSRVKEVPHE